MYFSSGQTYIINEEREMSSAERTRQYTKRINAILQGENKSSEEEDKSNLISAEQILSEQSTCNVEYFNC